MTTSDAIMERLKLLPGPAQREVLDFVEFLESRHAERGTEEAGWSGFSLASALRGMEEEDVPYTFGDVRESFR